jgi:hypothetical protein
MRLVHVVLISGTLATKSCKKKWVSYPCCVCFRPHATFWKVLNGFSHFTLGSFRKFGGTSKFLLQFRTNIGQIVQEGMRAFLRVSLK